MIATADTHCHAFKLCSRDGGADRRADGLRAVSFGLRAAQRMQEAWLHFGDVKHVRGTWDQVTLERLLAEMRDMRRVFKVMLCGNGYHDGLGVREPGGSGLEPFRPYALVFTTPTVVSDGPLVELFGGAVAVWPWQPTYGGLERFLYDARRRQARVLLGHAYLAGALIGPEERRLPGHGTALEAFGLLGKDRAFDYAFMGDIHKRQLLGGGKDAATIWYPGSPYQQNWGERNDLEKGVLRIQRQRDGTFTVVPLATPDVPTYMRLVVRTAADWTKLNSGSTAWARNQFVHLMVTPGLLTQRQVHDWEAAMGPRWLAFDPLPSGANGAPAASTTEPVVPGMSVEDMLRAYVQATPGPAGVTPTQLLAIGRKLMEEAG